MAIRGVELRRWSRLDAPAVAGPRIARTLAIGVAWWAIAAASAPPASAESTSVANEAAAGKSAAKESPEGKSDGTPAEAAVRPANRAELERLFAAFAAQGKRSARFVERRHSVLFRNPPEVRGTLTFTPPAVLERVTVTPRRERVRIEGQQVTLWTTGDDGQVTERSIRLDVVPQLSALAETLRAMLGGDLRTLERLFKVQMRHGGASAGGRWVLHLAPIDESIGALVRAVRIEGHAALVDRIEFTETSGDRSELAIAPLDAPRR